MRILFGQSFICPHFLTDLKSRSSLPFITLSALLYQSYRRRSFWYRFQYDITYRDLFISSFFRYLNLCQGFMKCYVIVLFQSTCLIIMTILIICSSPSLRSFTFGTDWSITLLACHRLYPSRSLYWSICSLIKIMGQQIHLVIGLQHFANELSLELQVHIFFNEDLDNSSHTIFSC